MHVDGNAHALGKRDAAYIGKGDHHISFTQRRCKCARRVLSVELSGACGVSDVQIARAAEATAAPLGDPATANLRKITRLIHLEGIKSCQLVMGFTELQTGSVWNTMPPHTHMRRSEVYLYFDLPAEHRVVHLMGPAGETRHLIVANKQVAISPGWSIHSGVGTASYSFCWGMGGENQVYTDMDALAIPELF